MSLASRLSHGKDKFGNYTVQRIIEHSRGDDWLELRERIEARDDWVECESDHHRMNVV